MGKTVGQIVGTIAGAVVGFFVGGPAGAVKGAAYGYGLGSMADPPDLPATEGPRLDDKQFQGTEYGAGIPTMHGDYAFKGTVVYFENGKYKEVSNTQDVGGKGGAPKQEHTTYRYLATFAVVFCRALPAGSQVRRLWLGSKLVFNADSNDLGTQIQSSRNAIGGHGWVDTATNTPFNTTQGGASWLFYDGTQTDPDPRMEAGLGVGNAPSYHGFAYMMFYDLDLHDFGNNLAGAQVKAEIITTPPTPNMTLLSTSIGEITTALGGGTEHCLYLTPQRMISVGVQASTPYNSFRIQSTPFDSRLSPFSGNSDSHPNSIYPEIRGMTDDANLSFSSYRNPYAIPERPSKFQSRAGKTVYCDVNTLNVGVLSDTFSATGGGYITINMADFSPTHTPWAITVSDFNVFVCARNTSNDLLIYVFDLSMSLEKIWNTGETKSNPSIVQSHAYYDSGWVYFAEALTDATYAIQRFHTETETVGDSVTVSHTSPFTTGSFNRAYNFAVFGNLVCSAEYHTSGGTTTFRHKVWKMFDYDRNGASLEDVVRSICNRSGIPDSSLNLSALSSDVVKGYLEAAPASGRGNLSALLTAFMFDMIEDGYTLRAVKRGGSPIKTITHDELGAMPAGSDPDTLISREREMIHRLPSSYTISYIDYNREYENNSQTATMSTNGFNERIEPLPVVLGSNEAAQIADKLGKINWAERDSVNFTLSLDHTDLKASDIITVETTEGVFEDVRIDRIVELHDQRVSITGKITSPGIYSSTHTGSDGIEPDSTIAFIGDSEFFPVDCPMLLDSMDNYGVVSGMAGQGKYPGGVLMVSSDGGQTYERLNAYPQGITVGETTDSLGGGEFLVRDSSATLNVKMISGTLSSVTFEQMLGGKNYVAYGLDGRWELMQFQNATLESDGTYTLDTFFRGQKETHRHMNSHEIGDNVVFLSTDNLIFMRFDSSDVGVARDYKPVTVGQSTDYVDSVSYTYNAENIKPLPGVNPSASLSGSDLVISWTGSTRYNSNYWVTGAQPLNETTLSYEVDILDVRGVNVLRTISSSSTSATYLSADQTTDFGSNVTRVMCNIYQIGNTGLRGNPLSAYVYANGYATTFKEFPLGDIDEIENGWRFRFDASSSIPFRINSESTAIDGTVLEIAPTSTNTYMYTRPKIENFADGEALYKTRLNANFGGAFGMCYLRASGGPSTRTGYVCYINNGPDTITVLRLIDGAFTIIGNISKSVSSGTWYWVRFRVQGTSIQARMWADGAAEPGSWDINGTNSEITGEGWGAIGTSVNTSMNYDSASIEVL